MVSLSAPSPSPEATLSSSTSSSSHSTNPWAGPEDIQEQGYVHVTPTLVQRNIHARKLPLPTDIDEETHVLPVEDAAPPQIELVKAVAVVAMPKTTFVTDFAEKASSVLCRGACGASRFAGVTALIALRCLTVLLKVTPIALFVTYITMFTMRRFANDVLFDTVWGRVCNDPNVSFVCPSPPARAATSSIPIPDLPKLIQLQTGFEGIVESSFGMTLAVDLKQSEMALRDLNTLVKVSDLESKQFLSRQLDKVVAQAKRTGTKLQRLGGKVGTAIDSIVSMDEYVLRSLANINLELISAGVTEDSSLAKRLVPFWSNSALVVEEQKQELIRVFDEVSAQLDTLIKKLIFEAEVSAFELDRLEGMLDNVYETVTREKKGVESKEKALSELWKSLIDKSRAAVYESHKDLLDNIVTYRKDALNRVTATAVQLRQLSLNLDSLRERVAAPSLVGTRLHRDQDRGGLPIEEHIASVRMGVEKLSDFRARGIQRENEVLDRLISAPPV